MNKTATVVTTPTPKPLTPEAATTRLTQLTAAHNLHLDRTVLTVAPEFGALHEVSGKRWPGPPKTPASARDIALPPFLVHGLRVLDSNPYETLFCTATSAALVRLSTSAA